MNKLQNNTTVYTVSSLEEMYTTERSLDSFSLRNLGGKGLLTILVALCNVVLSILQLVLFKRWNAETCSPRTIVVYTFGALGDNVVLLPVIASLKKRYPSATVTVVTTCFGLPIRDFFLHLPYVDHAIQLDDQPVVRRGVRLMYSAEELSSLKADLFVNLSPFGNRGVFGFVLREMIFAKKINAQWSVGFRLHSFSIHNRFLDLQHYFVKNEPRRWKEILASLNIPVSSRSEFLPIRQSAESSMKQKIGFNEIGGKHIMVVNPGSKYLSRCWNAERFGAIALWLKERYNAVVFVNTTENEREIARTVIQTSGHSAVDLCGTLSQAELIELLRLSALCVTNNTGTMHAAASLDIPIVAIFGTWISPTHWFPDASTVKVLCSFSESSYSYSETGGTEKNIERIQIEDVKRAIEHVMEARR
ncbi:MAG: glycosyltransferase family 9 protein [Bacteroidota bacterium]